MSKNGKPEVAYCETSKVESHQEVWASAADRGIQTTLISSMFQIEENSTQTAFSFKSWRISSYVNISLNATILTSSSQELIVVYPYPHKLHFLLSSLSLVSHLLHHKLLNSPSTLSGSEVLYWMNINIILFLKSQLFLVFFLYELLKSEWVKINWLISKGREVERIFVLSENS